MTGIGPLLEAWFVAEEKIWFLGRCWSWGIRALGIFVVFLALRWAGFKLWWLPVGLLSALLLRKVTGDYIKRLRSHQRGVRRAEAFYQAGRKLPLFPLGLLCFLLGFALEFLSGFWLLTFFARHGRGLGLWQSQDEVVELNSNLPLDGSMGKTIQLKFRLFGGERIFLALVWALLHHLSWPRWLSAKLFSWTPFEVQRRSPLYKPGRLPQHKRPMVEAATINNLGAVLMAALFALPLGVIIARAAGGLADQKWLPGIGLAGISAPVVFYYGRRLLTQAPPAGRPWRLALVLILGIGLLAAALTWPSIEGWPSRQPWLPALATLWSLWVTLKELAYVEAPQRG